MCNICLLFLSVLALELVVSQNHPSSIINLGKSTTINLSNRTFTITRQNGQQKFIGSLGMKLPKEDIASVTLEEDSIFAEWPSASLDLNCFVRDGVECSSVKMEAKTCVTEVLQDCFSLKGAHWYGGSEMFRQLWPLEKVSMDFGPYVTNDCNPFPYGTVQERYFFSSSGIGIYIDEDVPLFVAINASGDQQLCFQAKYSGFTYRNYDNALPILKYTICHDEDVLSIHKAMSSWYIKKPNGIPSEDVLRRPIWSTWPEYKKTINQSHALEFANEIKQYEMDISNFEIDEEWMPHFGDIEFDLAKFPDPKALIAELHGKGMSSTFWISPFVNLDSSNFKSLSDKGYLMKDMSGNRPALTSWWEAKYAGIIDFTNPEASKWFFNSLSALRLKYGIDSFKFDAGDANYLPTFYKPNSEFRNPTVYSRTYVEAISDFDDTSGRHEVRPGARTQHRPGFVRMLDRYSNWSDKQGFRTLIPTALVFSILGYPFVLPDMIGGNLRNGVMPDAELFLRWLQVTTLMPSMQFGLRPWKFNSTVISITKEMLNLRYKYADKIVSLAKESISTGFPIIRPLWWIAPTDESALTVDDEFLLGDDLLVAPVMEPGVTGRRVYLPVGTWRDEIRGGNLTGNNWIDYPVRLSDLPIFTKLD